MLQSREPAELGRDRARECIPLQSQPSQAVKAPKLRRDRAREVIGGEIQADNAAGGIRIDPVPVFERRVRQPVVVAVPMRSVRRLVERHQDIAVDGRTALHSRAVVDADPVEPGSERRLRRDAEGGIPVPEFDEREGGERERQTARERVVPDPERGHPGEAPDVGRQAARQAVAPQVDTLDPTEGIGRHPVPFVQCRGLTPPPGIDPVRPTGGLVQEVKHTDVRLVAVRSGGFDPRRPFDVIGRARHAETRVPLEADPLQRIEPEKALGDPT